VTIVTLSAMAMDVSSLAAGAERPEGS